jgi:hypothetical protein
VKNDWADSVEYQLKAHGFISEATPAFVDGKPALKIDWTRISDETVLGADIILEDVLDAEYIG